MISVTKKPFMLSVIKLNVIVLNVIVLNVIVLNAIMLNVIMLNVIMLSVIMLNVVAPITTICKFHMYVTRAQFYKTFFVRNLRIFVIS
jgi:hypothetical protein